MRNRSSRVVFLVCTMALALVGAGLYAKRRPARATITHLLQRIWILEDQRVSTEMFLTNSLSHPSGEVRRAAILALGRIGEPDTLMDLASLLNRRAYPDKNTVAFALGLFEDQTAATILVQHIAMQKDETLLRALYQALGRGGGPKQADTLAQPILKGGPDRILESACWALGLSWSQDSEEWETPPGLIPALTRSVSSSKEYAAACAFALSRFKGNPLLLPPKDLITAAEASPRIDVKIWIARALGRTREPLATAALTRWAYKNRKLPLRIEAVKALAHHAFDATTQVAFEQALADTSVHLVAQGLDSLTHQGLRAAAMSGKVTTLLQGTPSTWLKARALRALAALDPTGAKALMEPFLQSPEPSVAGGAVFALAAQARPEDKARLPTFLAHENTRITLDAMEAVSGFAEDAWTPEMKEALKKTLERGDPALSAAAAQLVARYEWRSYSDSLLVALGKIHQADQVEPKVAILSALASLGESRHVTAIKHLLTDPQKPVAMAAREALASLAKGEKLPEPPSNSVPQKQAFDWEEIERARQSVVVLQTTRGSITLQMLADTPLNALNFTRLVKKKFYDGLSFHRVVPGFVVQGGDPRGDGFGGSGYMVRDEFTATPQTRGTVGIATTGKDTGGSQFYISLADNRHLDSRYTVFARVISGMDVVDKIQEGDRILNARVR